MLLEKQKLPKRLFRKSFKITFPGNVTALATQFFLASLFYILT